MKTGQYYFDKLSEVEQNEFRKNLSGGKNIKEYLAAEYESFEKFLKRAFIFLFTSQGIIYWVNIANRKVD